MATSRGITPGEAPAALSARFDFLAELGSGAAGTVYRARTRVPVGDVEAGTEVAVKVLRADRTRDDGARQQLAREAAIGRTVRSDYVIRIWAAEKFDDETTPSYVVMEYVEGRTLREVFTESGPITGQLANRIGEHAARGLHALHSHGVVHRDVKPENLLLTDYGELKLMDLGLAHRGEAAVLASSGGFHGSFAYAAPEVLRGRPHTESADLYALGVVLFEVVTGVHPFRDAATSPDAMMQAHLEQTPPRPSHLAPRVSALLDTLINELLSKRPERRPGPALEVARALQHGEASRYWRRRERHAPVLASRGRLQALRRSVHTEFVDRRTERKLLDRALRDARSGHGKTVHISGARGAGRRRLCDEVIGRWLGSDDPPTFLGGRADRRTADLPATPFPQILLDWFLRGESANSPRSVERVRARVVEQLGWDESDAARLADIACGVETEIGAATRADSIARAILAIVDLHDCTVLRIDRCELFDATGALVMRALSDACLERRLLILLAGTNLPFETSLRVELHGLAADAFTEFGTALFRSGEAPPATLFEAAHATTTGLPQALLDSLEECEHDGLLEGRPGDYHDLAPSVTRLRPTRTTVQRLKQRLTDLPPERRFVLQAAAVLGREFALADLAELTGRPELEVLEGLASFDGRLVRTQADRGIFAHRDLRRALLDSIEPAARRRLHRAAAWLLEDRDAPKLEIGMHLSRAGLDRECIEPLLAGLERLVARGSRRIALRVAERVRLHLRRRPDDDNSHQRLRLRSLAAAIHVALGNSDRARSLLRKSSALAARLGEPVKKAEALTDLAEIELRGGGFVNAMQLLTDVETALADAIEPESDAARAAARAFGLQSRVLAYQGHVDDALALARRARDLAPRNDEVLRSHLLVDLGRWRALHTHFSAADKSFVAAMELADRNGDVGTRMRALLHHGRMLTWLGERGSGEARMRECADTAQRVDDRRVSCRADLFLGEMLVYYGESGLEHLDRARLTATRVGDRVTSSYANALRILSGVDDDVEHDEDVGVPQVTLMWHFAHARAARRRGDLDRANVELARAVEVERELRMPLPLRVVLLRAVGRDSAARRLPENVATRLPRGLSRRRFLAAAAGWRV